MRNGVCRIARKAERGIRQVSVEREWLSQRSMLKPEMYMYIVHLRMWLKLLKLWLSASAMSTSGQVYSRDGKGHTYMLLYLRL